MSLEQAYIENNMLQCDPTNIVNIKSAQNISHSLNKSQKEVNPKSEERVKENTFVKSLKFEHDRYHTFNFKTYMLKDMERFCIEGSTELNVDTTFDLVYGLWLTDTSHRNLAMVDKNGNHPQFSGPSMQHYFRKDRHEFRAFAAAIVNVAPKLLKLKNVGHDLDLATAQVMEDIFTDVKHLWCTWHMQGRDKEQLNKMKANERAINKIMTDIYGQQDGYVIQHALADAENAEDFSAKLQSLQQIWESLVPGFYNWFFKNHAQKFKECLTRLAQEQLEINIRYYNNNLELKHRQQKKKSRDLNISVDISQVSGALEK